MTGEPATGFTLRQLAEHCGLPLAVVRRWRDQDLLAPEAGHVDRFAFRAVGRARALATLWRAGWSATRIAKAWLQAQRVLADPEEALRGLAASIGQRRLLVRAADGRLLEVGGQLLFDFASAPTAPVLPALRSPADWFQAAVDAELAGRLDEAIRAYQNALPGGGAEAHFNLGNCLYAARRRDEAREQFALATHVAPDFAEAWNNLGIVGGELGDHPAAVAALEEALRLVPHYADAHYNLAEALAVCGDLDAARRHWRAYLSFDPNSRWADLVRRRLLGAGS